MNSIAHKILNGHKHSYKDKKKHRNIPQPVFILLSSKVLIYHYFIQKNNCYEFAHFKINVKPDSNIIVKVIELDDFDFGTNYLENVLANKYNCTDVKL